MKLPRRQLLHLAAGAAALGAVSQVARAQTYPNKLVKLVVPLAAGGTPDTVARLIARYLSAELGQAVIVDNHPGAGTSIGLKAAATAAPDGYTLLVGSAASLAVNPALYKTLDFALVKSLTPVAMVATSPLLLGISSVLPVKTVEELIAYAKAHPGKLSHGATLGTPPHLLGEFFKFKTGIDINYIPYKSTASALTDLLGGQVQMTAESPSVLLPLISQGKLRAVAITSVARSRDLPDVPTMIESGLVGFPPNVWVGIMAPPGTPLNIVGRLNSAINKALSSSGMKSSLAKLGFEPEIRQPQDFAAFIGNEAPKWAEIVKLSGVTID
jgi:tripartite-type tricarboxylate transporter receptor subunit TctC